MLTLSLTANAMLNLKNDLSCPRILSLIVFVYFILRFHHHQHDITLISSCALC